MVSSDHYDPPAGLSRSVADLVHRHRSAAAQPQGGHSKAYCADGQSGQFITFRSSPTVFADTPVPASASTRILAGKPPRAMSSAAVFLHLYRGIGSLLIALSGQYRA